MFRFRHIDVNPQVLSDARSAQVEGGHAPIEVTVNIFNEYGPLGRWAFASVALYVAYRILF